MKNRIRTYSRVLLAVALGTLPMMAQDDPGFDVLFKARVGYGMKAAETFNRQVIGFGVEVGYTNSIGRFAAELGFQRKSGDRYLYKFYERGDALPGTFVLPPLDADRYANPDPTTYTNFPNYYLTNEGGPVSPGDVRRDEFSGMTLRLSYERMINESWLWRAGVQLFGTRYWEEHRGNVIYRNPAQANDPAAFNPPDHATAPNRYVGQHITDVYAGRQHISDVSPSPYIGIAFKSGGNNRFELNLIGLSYTRVEYIHVAGTGSPVSGHNNAWNPGNFISRDYTKEHSTMLPHIEVAYGFRF